MKKKDKELLLKDLSARLPYGVKVYDTKGNFNSSYQTLAHINGVVGEAFITSGMACRTAPITDLKPYLFPISSMTEGQKNECFNGSPLEIDKYGDVAVKDDFYGNSLYTDLEIYLEVINWLLKNHFDIYGLIAKGLAIDCSNLNIY